MMNTYAIHPVGTVHTRGDEAWIEIFPEYQDGLLGLEGFSHIIVLYWFHENDTPEKRQTLRVHPRGDDANPLTGVFATHAPVRPNLIALTRCRILAVTGNLIRVDEIDARDGSPVIDIKSYFPETVSRDDIKLPDWA